MVKGAKTAATTTAERSTASATRSERAVHAPDPRAPMGRLHPPAYDEDEARERRIKSFGVLLLGIFLAWLFSEHGAKHLVRDFCTDRQLEIRACRQAIDANLANHTFLHVGGQHRGGTTLLWRGLAAHPMVSAMQSDHASAAADEHSPHHLHGEGIFFQSIYPSFSLNHPPKFFWKKRLFRTYCDLQKHRFTPRQDTPSACRLLEGVGSYALSPEARKMLEQGPRHPLVDADTARHLFSQWGPRWDLNAPILLEKSPSNAIMSGVLSGLWAAAATRPAKFIFVSRHPLMHAVSMRSFVDDLSNHEIVENWLAVETAVQASVRTNLPSGSAALCSLEGITRRPVATLHALLAWAGVGIAGAAERVSSGTRCEAEGLAVLDADAAAVSGEHAVGSIGGDAGRIAEWANTVRSRPNEWHAVEYGRCDDVETSHRHDVCHVAKVMHRQTGRSLGNRVAAVSGYDLRGDPWTYHEPPSRPVDWWQSWCAEPPSDEEVEDSIARQEAAHNHGKLNYRQQVKRRQFRGHHPDDEL